MPLPRLAELLDWLLGENSNGAVGMSEGTVAGTPDDAVTDFDTDTDSAEAPA